MVDLGFSFLGVGEDWVWTQGFVFSVFAKAGTQPLEPHLQSILLWLLWRWSLKNYLPKLASNPDPPDFSLPK
jgi:hypothetical protein